MVRCLQIRVQQDKKFLNYQELYLLFKINLKELRSKYELIKKVINF